MKIHRYNKYLIFLPSSIKSLILKVFISDKSFSISLNSKEGSFFFKTVTLFLKTNTNTRNYYTYLLIYITKT